MDEKARKTQETQIKLFTRDLMMCLKGIENTHARGEEVDWLQVADYLSMVQNVATDKYNVGICASDSAVSNFIDENTASFSKDIDEVENKMGF